MRFGSNLKIVGLALLFLAGCQLSRHSGATLSELKPEGNYAPVLVPSTYFGGSLDYRNGPGPGHFACMNLQEVSQWYLAASDTFGDPAIWDAPVCPPGANGIPECTKLMETHQICGRKVKIKCGGDNCRSDAPEIVVQITDACPRDHWANKQSGACQNGPAFDLSQAAWELLHARHDNVSVYYQRVDDATPLGPVAPASVAHVSGTTASDGKFYPYCTNGSQTGNGFGWQPDLGGPSGGSCIVPGAASQSNASVTSPAASSSAPPATPAASTSSSPPPSSTQAGVQATIQIESQWTNGYCAKVIVKNTGTTSMQSWTVVLNTNAATISQSWNLTLSSSSGQVTLTPQANWNGALSPGAATDQQGFCVDTQDVSIQATVLSARAQ